MFAAEGEMSGGNAAKEKRKSARRDTQDRKKKEKE
jgi:hypothetical protein